jgi:hypothetical protein
MKFETEEVSGQWSIVIGEDDEEAASDFASSVFS